MRARARARMFKGGGAYLGNDLPPEVLRISFSSVFANRLLGARAGCCRWPERSEIRGLRLTRVHVCT